MCNGVCLRSQLKHVYVHVSVCLCSFESSSCRLVAVVVARLRMYVVAEFFDPRTRLVVLFSSHIAAWMYCVVLRVLRAWSFFNGFLGGIFLACV